MTARARIGRPRSSLADVAIHRATLELLALEGLRGLRIERVAARAGVGKTTVYRRYPTKRDLVAGALAAVLQGEPPELPDTGDVREDLRELTRRRVATIRSSGAHTLMPRLVLDAAGDPELQELISRVFVAPSRAPVVAVLRRAVERGQLRTDLDPELATDLIAGSALYRLMISGSDIDAVGDLPERAIDLVIEGARRAGPA